MFYYYILTTLSSVGFGDLVPKSNVERVVGSFIMLLGVAMFSYVQNVFFRMAFRLKDFNQDYDDFYLFQNFVNVMAKFNQGPIQKELREKMLRNMQYIWDNSKNFCIHEDHDR